MTRDELEHALRSTADPVERAYRAAPLPASVEDARYRAEHRRGPSMASWRFARATAAVALAVVVAVGVAAGTRLLSEGSGPGSGGILPTHGSSASAPPSVSASPLGRRACGAADFAITSDPWDAGAGSRGTRVVFRAADSLEACVLDGRLAARIVGAGGEVLVAADSDTTVARTVAGGTQLEIGVAWSNWCGAAPSEPLELRVRLPDDPLEIPIVPPAGTSVLVPPCTGGGQDTSLSITAFEASNRPPPEG